MLQIEPAPPQDWPLWRALDSHLSEEAFCRAAQGQMTRWIKTDGGIVGILRYQLFWETIPFLTLLLLKEAHRRQGFGRAAMALWESELVRAGHRMVLVSARADESAQHFYRTLGYRDCGCLPLDCECYMLGKCWTGAYCRYFRSAVLPLDPVLELSLIHI